MISFSPAAVIDGTWRHGEGGYWDRVTALRESINALGGVGLDGGTQAQIHARIRAIERVYINWSYDDCNDFCAYSVTDPTTGAPIFQERMHFEIQRALDSDRSVAVEAYRSSGKSTQMEPRIIWRLGHDCDDLIKLVSEAKETAEDRVRNIRNHVELNPRVGYVFPQLQRQLGMPWNDHSITITRALQDRNPSLFGAGILSRVVGGRCRTLIGDDATPPESLVSEAVRITAKSRWSNVWAKMLVQDGRIWFFYTPWGEQDLASEIRASSHYLHLRFAVGGPQGCDKCPERGGLPCGIPFHNPWSPLRWPPAALQVVYERDGPLSYDLSHRLIPYASSSTLFPPHLFTGDAMRVDLVMRRPWRVWASLGVHTVMGMDLAISGGAANDFLVIFVLGWDEKGNKYIIDIQRFKSSDYRVQLQRLADAAAKYRPDLIFIEGTQYQRVFTDILRVTTGLPVQPFYPLGRGKGKRVEGADKKDLAFGVPSLRIEMENGKWQFPRGDEYSRDMTDILFAELRAFTFTERGKLEGVGAHDDTPMAMWIANEAARKMGAGLVETDYDARIEAARKAARMPAVGLIEQIETVGKQLGPRLEGLEDLLGTGPKGLLSNAHDLGLVLAKGAGTQVVRQVPVSFGDREQYEDVYGALEDLPPYEVAALGPMAEVLGRVPSLQEMLQGGLSPRTAGTLSGLVRRAGLPALLAIVEDRRRQLDDEQRLLTTVPPSEEDDLEEQLMAATMDPDEYLEEMAGRFLG